LQKTLFCSGRVFCSWYLTLNKIKRPLPPRGGHGSGSSCTSTSELSPREGLSRLWRDLPLAETLSGRTDTQIISHHRKYKNRDSPQSMKVGSISLLSDWEHSFHHPINRNLEADTIYLYLSLLDNSHLD
jgi:hypothetical protein